MLFSITIQTKQKANRNFMKRTQKIKLLKLNRQANKYIGIVFIVIFILIILKQFFYYPNVNPFKYDIEKRNEYFKTKSGWKWLYDSTDKKK